jgi:hypothetical protein
MLMHAAMQFILGALKNCPDFIVLLWAGRDGERIEVSQAAFEQGKHESGIGWVEQFLSASHHVDWRCVGGNIDRPNMLSHEAAGAARRDPGAATQANPCMQVKVMIIPFLTFTLNHLTIHHQL